MKNKSLIALLGLFTLIFFNCKSDDSTTETELTLDQIVAKVTDNGNLKTWKIESATLTNSSVNALDVTNAFNIKDDEFRFSQENNVLQLEHRQRHDFNKNATDYQNFLLEAYKSALNYTLINNVNTPTEINSTDNTLKFNFQNDDLITGEWILDANTKLTFNLSVKNAADYPTVPTSLNFEEVATVPSEYNFYSSLGSADVLSSQSNNSLYLVYSTDNFENPNPDEFFFRAEGLISYNTTSNQFNFNLLHLEDFFTKRAYINNNQLKTIGTQYLSTYNNLNTTSDPDTSLNYNTEPINYTRYGIINYNNLVHIIGGNFSLDSNSSDYFNEIRTYNEGTQTTETITTLPSPKCQAAAEIVDDNIYIFGGPQKFGNTNPESLSFIYNINSNSFTEFNLPEALNVSFAVAKENLIYVAGQVFVLNESNQITDINAFLGVYNTENNTFTEISHNLDDSDAASRIRGITYLNEELFIVFGNNNSSNTGETKIYKAAL